jgi:cysteine synthase
LSNPFDPPRDIVDDEAYENAVTHLRAARVVLPTFAELADPATIAPSIRDATAGVPPDAAHPANLFRVHWYNDAARAGLTDTPGHIVFDRSFTGVAAPIVVVLGERFPMIGAHKVLPAYACLATRLVTGQFDPTRHRAIWPSTGNYCRGGVAVSRILGCRGVAVLPEGMSRERFDWLDDWVGAPEDIVRTPGSESNVKEIYDKCAELEADPANVILNQFSEFANYLVHYQCTGRALEAVFETLRAANPELTLAAFVAGTGSAGTLGAGDYLKRALGARIVAVEPLECPTMLYNGYGEHNIQGIGDKHIPLIQNVMNTDIVAGVSDESCDSLNVLFNTEVGRRYLVDRRRLDPGLVAHLGVLGLSGIANVLAAIKTARLLDLGENDAIITVATDSAALYVSQKTAMEKSAFPDGFDAVSAGEVYARHVLGLGGDHMLEATQVERRRIFNLGYYTWVEQQGVSLADFDQRHGQRFWKKLQELPPIWDAMIEEFNRRTGVNRPG